MSNGMITSFTNTESAILNAFFTKLMLLSNRWNEKGQNLFLNFVHLSVKGHFVHRSIEVHNFVKTTQVRQGLLLAHYAPELDPDEHVGITSKNIKMSTCAKNGRNLCQQVESMKLYPEISSEDNHSSNILR